MLFERTIYPADWTDMSAYGFPKPAEFLRAELAGLYAELADLAVRVAGLVTSLDGLEQTIVGLRVVLL